MASRLRNLFTIITHKPAHFLILGINLAYPFGAFKFCLSKDTTPRISGTGLRVPAAGSGGFARVADGVEEVREGDAGAPFVVGGFGEDRKSREEEEKAPPPFPGKSLCKK